MVLRTNEHVVFETTNIIQYRYLTSYSTLRQTTLIMEYIYIYIFIYLYTYYIPHNIQRIWYIMYIFVYCALHIYKIHDISCIIHFLSYIIHYISYITYHIMYAILYIASCRSYLAYDIVHRIKPHRNILENSKSASPGFGW